MSAEIGADPMDSHRALHTTKSEVNYTLIFCRRAFHFLLCLLLSPARAFEKDSSPLAHRLFRIFINGTFPLIVSRDPRATRRAEFFPSNFPTQSSNSWRLPRPREGKEKERKKRVSNAALEKRFLPFNGSDRSDK